MHSLLKHKMLQFTLKIFIYMAATAVTRRTAPNAHTVYRLKLILPLHNNNFNDVFLTDDFKETVTLARLHRMLPDDGP